MQRLDNRNIKTSHFRLKRIIQSTFCTIFLLINGEPISLQLGDNLVYLNTIHITH